MSDIKLFNIKNNTVIELESQYVVVEKSLQVQIEQHLDSFFAITYLASEYSTGKVHGGRIDTLGIDENGCPVIIEYKRAVNQNVINQGLYYIDWLLDHRGEYELLVLKSCGKEISEKIDWSSPRLICIAGDYTKYDQHAVQQINRNIELIRYQRFGGDLLMFELVNATTAQIAENGSSSGKGVKYKTVSDNLNQLDDKMRDIFDALKSFLMSLGDDVQMKILKYYFAFKRIKNFACVELHTQARTILVFVKVNPEDITLEEGFTRDVRKIGHFGTGDLEITIRSMGDLGKARHLLEKSYELS
ncbi:DUF5655 domain-containing protein [Candidatus Latescibacterota bacterium]